MSEFRAFPRVLRCAWFFVVAAGCTFSAHAQSLLEVYKAAQGYDASYQAARSQFDATVARAEQARAGILPTVNLSANVSRNAQEVLPAPERSYGSQYATISASQPLYRPANLAAYEQGKKQLSFAQAQLVRAEQDLLVRVSQAYFDVLAATDNLAFVQSQKAAIGEQLASAQRNFEVGTATITATREAQSRFDLVVAQELAADNDLLIKSTALNQLVGQSAVQPKPLHSSTLVRAIDPKDVEYWVTLAQSIHPSIIESTAQLETAELETEKAQAGHKPTLDLTGSYTASNNNNGSSTTLNDSRVNQASIGLGLNLPLFAGFSIQNRVKETLALEEKARADLEAARRAQTQAARAAYFGVLSGQAQVKALEAAEASSQSALDANKLGYQVGVRINIDVLNSQSQLFDTKAKLARARYDLLLGGLKLRQASGILQVEDLEPINQLLAP